MRRAIALSGVLAVACSSPAREPTSPDAPPPRPPATGAPTVARVTVAPDTLTLPAGNSTIVVYTATLLDSAGHTLSGIGVRWSSSDSALAQPGQNDTTTTLYVAQGRDTGTAVITAAVGSQHGTATLRLAPNPLAVDLTGTWVSDTIHNADGTGCAEFGANAVKLVVTQHGDSASAQEFLGYCGDGPMTFDSAGPIAGPVSSPCLVQDCEAKLNLIPNTSDPHYGNGGTYWLMVAARDTLTNVTPDSADHSHMPTRFVRVPSP